MVNNYPLKQAACARSSTGVAQHHRRVDIHPGDSASSMFVRMLRMTAAQTDKPIAGFAVALVTIPAHVTGTASVVCIAEIHPHAVTLRFVTDKLAQLEERPTRVLPPLRTTNRCSRPNPRQVFKGECLALLLGLLDQSFADAVIHIPLEAFFFPGQLAQPPTRPACVFCL